MLSSHEFRNLSAEARHLCDALSDHADDMHHLHPQEALKVAHWMASQMVLRLSGMSEIAERAADALVDISIACQQGVTMLSRPPEA